jgi:hypothetical protein
MPMYLGLPLTHKKPNNGLFEPLISSLQHRLQGMTGSHLSLAGRSIILNSVLNALSMYYMQVFKLSQEVIDRIISHEEIPIEEHKIIHRWTLPS